MWNHRGSHSIFLNICECSLYVIYLVGYEVFEMSYDSDFKVVLAPPEEEPKAGREPVVAKPPAGKNQLLLNL